MTKVQSEALIRLAECAANRGVRAEGYGAGELLLTLNVPHVDGVRLLYRIVVSAYGACLLAREEPATRLLPQFCPERHIVGDGFFCMYWSAERSFDVVDSGSATAWLNLLLNFLRLQRRAARQRRWPNHETWAHGNAAFHQRRAEIAAGRLGPELKAALDARRLSARSESGGVLASAPGGPASLFDLEKS